MKRISKHQGTRDVSRVINVMVSMPQMLRFNAVLHVVSLLFFWRHFLP